MMVTYSSRQWTGQNGKKQLKNYSKTYEKLLEDEKFNFDRNISKVILDDDLSSSNIFASGKKLPL